MISFNCSGGGSVGCSHALNSSAPRSVKRAARTLRQGAVEIKNRVTSWGERVSRRRVATIIARLSTPTGNGVAFRRAVPRKALPPRGEASAARFGGRLPPGRPKEGLAPSGGGERTSLRGPPSAGPSQGRPCPLGGRRAQLASGAAFRRAVPRKALPPRGEASAARFGGRLPPGRPKEGLAPSGGGERTSLRGPPSAGPSQGRPCPLGGRRAQLASGAAFRRAVPRKALPP